MIRQTVLMLQGCKWGRAQEAVQAAQAALDASAAVLGTSGCYYLRDLRQSQQGYVRLVREVVALAASQQDKVIRVEPEMVGNLSNLQGLNDDRPLPASSVGQGRQSAQRIERSETLDRHTRKTLMLSPKTTFSEMPTGEGLVFVSPPMDNMGVENFRDGQNAVNMGVEKFAGVQSSVARPPAGDEDGAPGGLAAPMLAFDNDSYQKHKLEFNLAQSFFAKWPLPWRQNTLHHVIVL